MPATSSQKLACTRGQRRQAIVESILADIFRGRLKAGRHLVTQELAERFDVSHTPIREALITLAGIGIVDLLPNRGAVVRTVTARDVHDVCQVRKALECEATRSACGRIDIKVLRRFDTQFRKLTKAPRHGGAKLVAQARKLDSELHDLIAHSCGNAMLANQINQLKLLFRAFRDMAWQNVGQRNDYHRLADESHEHLAIVEGLLAGDGRAAAKAMARHIRSGMKYWSRALPA
jgi:DNA-binding GntR family transcriptional regulator